MNNFNNKQTTEQAVLKTMESESGQRTAFLCYYEWDTKSAFLRFVNSEEWDAILQILIKYRLPNKNVLDLGAGNGISSFALRKYGLNVFSVEPDPSMLVGYGALKKINDQEGLGIKQVSAFGENLPLPENRFGLVYCRQVLHHSKSLQKVTEEISRVLIPGGIFIATREHIIDDEKSKAIFLDNHPLHKYTHAEGAFRLQEYINALNNSGFVVAKVLRSWDSIINYYPTSRTKLLAKIRSYLRGKYSRFGYLIPIFPVFVKYYQHRLSLDNKTPGRMVSIIAIKR